MKIGEIRIEVHIDKQMLADVPQQMLDIIFDHLKMQASGSHVHIAAQSLESGIESNIDHYDALVPYLNLIRYEIKEKEYL